MIIAKRFLKPFILLAFLTSLSFGQSQPYLSAPVNGSTWEMTTPTLYWWYLPSPYTFGPYTYSVQVSTNCCDFTGSNLLVNATVSAYAAGYYAVSGSVGLIQGITYYWRVGVNGNYSAVWSFSPYNYGGVTTYAISASAGANGSISPSGTLSIARGSSQTFSIVPNRGYGISDVVVDNVSIGAAASYTFDNVTCNHSIRADFYPVPVFDTVYVSILGSDSDGDGSRAKPYRRIQRGHDKAKPNDIVYVFDGVYLEDVVLTKPVKIIGENRPSTRSFLVRANNISINNFNVSQSSPGPGIQKVGLDSYDHLDRLTLENIDSYNNAEMGLLLENIDTVEVRHCNFYGNDMGGIAVINCNHVSFTDIGVEDNLRGFAAYNTDYITINQLYSEDNGKAYLADHPDKNGLTFTDCNNISLTGVTSIKNQEQGLKFEDCSMIIMNEVSAVDNITDGIAFIESDQITFTSGAASKNGRTSDDNGIEIIGCDYVNFTAVAANENFHTGFHFHLYYKGVYKWDPAVDIPSPLPNSYIGPTANVAFTDVSACSNGNDGLYGMHLSYADITNPTFNGNGWSGLELDAAHHINLIDGTYDSNLLGLYLAPTENIHPVAPMLSTDEITSFSLTGHGSISNNEAGIVITPQADTKITNPLFYGSFNVFNNHQTGVVIIGEVEDPIFSGLYLKSSTSEGFRIADLTFIDPTLNKLVTGVKINDCYFEGYSNVSGRFAISLEFFSTGNVDARNNVFVGVGSNAGVEARIWHKNDNLLLGLVTFDGWTNGQPAIKIGSASAYTGSMVTIPVKVDISATPLSFTQLTGKLTFDEHKVRYRYCSYGAGTIIQDAGWAITFDHSLTSELRFMSMGFNAINYSGVLFTVTFEVADGVDGSAAIEGLAADFTINGGTAPFAVYNGTITYTASTSTSLVKGDATMDFTVDNFDYVRVINHVNGVLLTGQAFLNADVNKDNRVDELDAADIQAFVNTGSWPETASQALAELTFASSSIDQEGILRFPITLYNSSNVRSLQVDLNYDDSKLDFRNFRQLMQGNKYFVDVKTIAKGTTRLLFTSSDKGSGTLVPAELFFNLKSAGSTAGLITSTYSVNGSPSKSGPDYGSSSVTEVEKEEDVIPVSFNVEQNYPNPFNPSTTIKYSVPKAAQVTVKIYDILGGLVITLVNSEMPAGIHRVVWNGDNSSGSKVVSGPYFYQVSYENNIVTKKMLLIK